MKLTALFFSVATGFCFGQDLNQGLVGYFPFNGNSNDESTMNIDGVVSNAVLDTGMGNQTSGAYNFNGSNSYIECGISNRSITNVVTISFWVKTSGMGHYYPVSKYNWSEDAGYFTVINNGYAGTAGRDGSGSFRFTGYGTTNVADGTWHHIVSVVDENIWQIWVDCNLEAAVTTTTVAPHIQGTDPLIIGKWGYENSLHYNGLIDEVRIYNRTLTPTEMGLLCDESKFFAGIENNESKGYKLSIYPNPVCDLLKIESEEIQCLEIYSAGGSLVYSGCFENGISQVEINTAEFANGSYVLHVLYSEGIRSERFIISH